MTKDQFLTILNGMILGLWGASFKYLSLPQFTFVTVVVFAVTISILIKIIKIRRERKLEK